MAEIGKRIEGVKKCRCVLNLVRLGVYGIHLTMLLGHQVDERQGDKDMVVCLERGGRILNSELC
jgi:hypothetical protein